MAEVFIIDSKKFIPAGRASKVLSWLIALEVIVYAATLISPRLRNLLLLSWLPQQCSGNRFPLNFSLFSSLGYAFTHSSPLHLLCNIVFLWIVGNLLAQKSSLLNVMGVFFSGIFAGAFGFIVSCFLLHPAHEVALCGASTGVLALCGSLWATLRIPSRRRIYFLPLPFSSKAIYLPLKFTRLIPALCVIISLLSGLTPAAVGTHLAALAAGYIYGFVICNRPDPYNTSLNAVNNSATSLLIDKLQRSGYDSLSPDEKIRLKNIPEP